MLLQDDLFPLTVRCLTCGWTTTGEPHSTMKAGHDHRATHHPERVTARRAKPIQRPFVVTANLEENIRNVMQQGGATAWGGTDA